MMPAARGEARLRILHVILVLRATNSQYNEHSLPVMHERDISLCTYFIPQLTPPPQIKLFPGNDTLPGFFRALRNALAAGDYDAIHAHSPQAGVFVIMAMIGWFRFGLRRRTVYTVHDSFYDYKTRNKLLMIPALAVFWRVVFCSHAAYDSLPSVLKRLVGRRARVVQNGADIARIDRVIKSLDATPNDGFTIISIGRLEKVKDPLAALQAFAQSAEPNSRLVFVGEGELRPALEQAIADRGLQDRVTLTGLIEREEVFRHLVASDVFLSTSHGEGLPVAVMEAMACAVPLVLSDIPPHREFNADPDLIPLVPPGDVGGFAGELSRLQAMTREERGAVGRAARNLVVTGFSLENMNAGYAAIYRELRHSVPDAGS